MVFLYAHRAQETLPWWEQLSARQPEAPPLLAALLERERVMVLRRDLDGVLAWAARQPGWTDAPGRSPLIVADTT